MNGAQIVYSFVIPQDQLVFSGLKENEKWRKEKKGKTKEGVKTKI